MTDYLKRFVERASDVPLQLRRRLALIRDLDEKATDQQKEIEAQIKKMLAERSTRPAAAQPAKKQKLQHAADPASQKYDLQGNIARLNQLADEKVQIANKIYDFIDKHINLLDGDLEQLDAEIEAERAALGLDDSETACGKLSKAHEAKRAEPKKGKRTKQQQVKSEEEVAAPTLAVPSENEPAYCICQKPSAGNMVGCDNPDCPIEWFHFECVGLTETPNGEWLCPQCRGALAGDAPKAPKRAK